METPKIKSVEDLRKEYLENQCETMEGDDTRFEVYENDGDLVADWWLDKITQDRASIHTSLVAAVEGLKLDTSPAEGYNNPDADAYNKALDDVISIINKTF